MIRLRSMQAAWLILCLVTIPLGKVFWFLESLRARLDTRIENESARRER